MLWQADACAASPGLVKHWTQHTWTLTYDKFYDLCGNFVLRIMSLPVETNTSVFINVPMWESKTQSSGPQVLCVVTPCGLQAVDEELPDHKTWLFVNNAVRTSHVLYYSQWAGTAKSVQRFATDWKVRGSKPNGGKIFSTCPDRLGGTPILLHNECRIPVSGVKRPGRRVNNPPPI